MEDSRIIGLFFERSEQAVHELELKYGRAVRKLSLNILGDARDAEECAADTYLGVWNSVPPKRPERLKAYTLAIARNLSLDRYHANSAKKRNGSYDLALSELEGCLAAAGDAQTELEARELAEAMNRFLSGLSREDRQLFVCRYYLAEPVKDIAARLKVKSGRVSLRLFRIREKLKNYLEREGLIP